MLNRILSFAMVAIVTNSVAVNAQEPTKPGAEHAVLKKWEGAWNVTMKMEGMESKGSQTAKMELGGLWLVSEFSCELGGQKFTGKGLDTYDATKKKYVSVWVDSMSTSPIVLEGTHDQEKHATTLVGEGNGPDGKPMKYKSITTWKDDNTVNFDMYMGDTKTPSFTVIYTRKK
jgi:hypothetical protein